MSNRYIYPHISIHTAYTHGRDWVEHITKHSKFNRALVYILVEIYITVCSKNKYIKF